MRKYGDDTDLRSDRITTTENNNRFFTIKCPKCGKKYQSVGYSPCPYCKKSKSEQKTSKPKYDNSNLNNQNYNESPNSGYYKAVKCTKCGKTYNRAFYDLCPFCARSKSKHKTFKPKYKNPNLISCSKCGKQYNKFIYGECPHCRKSKSKHSTGKSNKNSSKYHNRKSKSTGSFKRYNGKVNPKSHTEGLNNPFHKCPKCGKLYNKNIQECPYCNMAESYETSSNKHFSKTKYKPNNLEIVLCPKCGKKKVKGRPCSYCTHIVVCSKCAKQYNKKHKGKWVTSCPHCGTSNIINCRKCGKEYNKIQHESCPYCGSNQRNAKTILAFCIALIIIFIIIMMFLL